MKYNKVISSDIYVKREVAVRAKLEKIKGWNELKQSSQ